ncbi:hypothetical protein [Mesorhizobium sp. B2-4-17]|uniref:hypothetical protein n=1 Tax=Mesorhizobium sp. B2-4-17 TaxID=2589932 RepID=UPI00112CD51C|nr:hypothetical protein [Mesorhizobium sp. B2-4-17]TPK85318.1 hypothetical protein FJ548_17405 [Mesorhizobium sp. B2-4-17]
MSKSLSISEAVALVANPAGAAGFQTESVDDTSSNVVALDTSKRGGLSIAQGAALLAESETKRGGGGQVNRAKFRDPGGRLSIAQGAQLLAGATPKYDRRPLTKAQGVDMLLGRRAGAEKGALTKREGVELLTRSGRPDVQEVRQPTATSDYVIASQNASIALANADADLQNLEREMWAFVNSAAAAFPDVVARGDNAVIHLNVPRFGQWLVVEERFNRFKEIAPAFFAQRNQAWNNAIWVENNEFLAQNPDFEASDADAMAAVLLLAVGPEEANALVTTPMMVSASDPRVFEVLKIAAGSDDPESIIETLRGAGFTDADIAAIGSGAARCHVLDHRVKSLVLRASRNIDFSEDED